MSLNVSKCLEVTRNVSKCLEMSRNKSPNKKREIKVQTEKGNKCPNRIWKSKLVEKQKSFLRPRCEIAVKNIIYEESKFLGQKF